MNADGWHKVSEYLPHLQAVRLAEKRMSTLEIAVPPQMSEKSVDAIVPSVDTGVQAIVEIAESSVQFSPVMVDQEISAVPGVNEVSIDARPHFSEASVQVIPAVPGVNEVSIDARPHLSEASVQVVSAVPGVNEVSIDARPHLSEASVQVIPTLLDKSIGTTVVGRASGPSTNRASKSLEPIEETVEPKETPTNHRESAPAPKPSFPKRFKRAFTFPIRFLLCSAKPVEDGRMLAEDTSTSSNVTREK
jgi:hypothetical protein